jgi:hypothetical protein
MSPSSPSKPRNPKLSILLTHTRKHLQEVLAAKLGLVPSVSGATPLTSLTSGWGPSLVPCVCFLIGAGALMSSAFIEVKVLLPEMLSPKL